MTTASSDAEILSGASPSSPAPLVPSPLGDDASGDASLTRGSTPHLTSPPCDCVARGEEYSLSPDRLPGEEENGQTPLTRRSAPPSPRGRGENVSSSLPSEIREDGAPLPLPLATLSHRGRVAPEVPGERAGIQASPVLLPAKLHWPSVGQLAFGGFGLVSLWSLAGAGFTIGVTPLLSGEPVATETVSWWMRSAGAFLGGLLFLPSMAFALLRILDRPIPAWIQPGKAGLAQAGKRTQWEMRIWIGLAVLWLLSLLAGQWAIDRTELDGLLLPPLYLLVTVLPIWGLVRLGTGGLPTASGQRSLQREWGIFSTSLVIGPGLAFVLEIGVILLVFAALIVAIASNPQTLEALQRTAQRLANAQDNPEAIARILRPYLARPSTLFLLLGFISGLVPLIEELAKPLVVWLFARRLQPAEGFAAGILCGAAFALYESLNMISMAPQTPWMEVAVSRVGTDVLHITTSGLVGFAIASTGRDGRYLRLAGIYLLAVTLHGVWNMFSVLAGISPLLGLPSEGLSGTLQAPVFSPIALGLMTAGLLGVLVYTNRRLRKDSNHAVTV